MTFKAQTASDKNLNWLIIVVTVIGTILVLHSLIYKKFYQKFRRYCVLIHPIIYNIVSLMEMEYNSLRLLTVFLYILKSRRNASSKCDWSVSLRHQYILYGLIFVYLWVLLFLLIIIHVASYTWKVLSPLCTEIIASSDATASPKQYLKLQCPAHAARMAQQHKQNIEMAPAIV